MASYTGNLGLKKPALDDDALITDINNNMDILDAAVNGIQDGLAIVANGNTHVAITSGQFVYVRNHGTLTEGLYVASSNIAANATLSTSNLTADAAGGLNALNGKTMQANETISDCNNAVNGRAYNFVSGALHRPDFHYGTLFQIGTMLNSSSYKMQIACDVVENHFAFRKTPNDSWGNEPWHELALNSKIVTEDLGSLASQSALETALTTLGGSMSDMQFKNIMFAFSAVPSSSVFNGKRGYYIGEFKRVNNNIYAVDVQNSGTSNQLGEHITGTYNGSAWTWMDLNDKVHDLGLTRCFQFNLTEGNYESTAYDNRFVSGGYYLIVHGLQNEKSNIYVRQCVTNGQMVCNAVTGGPFTQYNNFAFGIGNL